MRLTLYDNIHSAGGQARPEARPAIAEPLRARWVKVIHERLARCVGDEFAAAFDLGRQMLRVQGRRHGKSLSALWGVGAPPRVVAATVLLTGDNHTDDSACLSALAELVPPLPFGAADYDDAASRQRPCLATFYVDAEWYNNSIVELAATSLALAALFGPEGVLRNGQAGPAPAPPPAPPLKFNFTRERLQLVMGMVQKKANAAIEQRPGVHFQVYPPEEFLRHPDALRQDNIYDRLKAMAWWVRWYDNHYDRLSFGEFIGFMHQVMEIEKAFAAAVQRQSGVASAPQNSAVWNAPEPRPVGQRQPLQVKAVLDARELTRDETIRRMLAAVKLEPLSLSPEAHVVRRRPAVMLDRPAAGE